MSAIVKAAKGYDYLILGAPQESWIKRRFFTSKPLRIAQRVDCPVVLVRPKASPIEFGLRRLFKFMRGEPDLGDNPKEAADIEGFHSHHPRPEREDVASTSSSSSACRKRKKSLKTLSTSSRLRE